MIIGGGAIFLIALGAILTFAVNDQTIGPLDLAVVGWILMLAGLAGLVLSLYAWNSRRRVVVTPPSQADYTSRPFDDVQPYGDTRPLGEQRGEERRIRRDY